MPELGTLHTYIISMARAHGASWYCYDQRKNHWSDPRKLPLRQR